MSTPIISVGMPVFNGERYVAQAIESVLDQSFRGFELIISDNASSDCTPEICRRFAQRDPRIRYFRQAANRGAPWNFDFVLDRAVGKYFKWAAANDICDRELLSKCLEVLGERESVVVCFGKARFIDECGNTIHDFEDDVAVDNPRPSDRFIHLIEHLRRNHIHAGLFRTEVLRKTAREGTYREGDLVRMAELSLHGLFIQIPEFLFYRRMTPDTATSCRTPEAIREILSPGARSLHHWPRWRRALGYFAAVLRSRVGLAEQTRLLAYLLKRCYWHRNLLWREILENLRVTWRGSHDPSMSTGVP